MLDLPIMKRATPAQLFAALCGRQYQTPHGVLRVDPITFLTLS